MLTLHTLLIVKFGVRVKFELKNGFKSINSIYPEYHDLGVVNGLWYIHVLIFGSLSWFRRCKDHPYHLSPHLGLLGTLEVSDWALAFWLWFGYGHLSLIHQCSKYQLSILILKLQRTSMSFKSSFGALEDAVGSWLGFGIMILIWI